jgi:hypothetical protein
MEKRWCSACGRAFEPRPQSPRQAYCPKEDCQQARKRLWQQAKRSTDYGYYENQVQSQERWRRRHSDYWRQYRKDHPDYAASNRDKQKDRNARIRHAATVIANSDASSNQMPTSGIFRLVDMQANQAGIHQEWFVRLTLIPKPQDF